MLLIKARLSLSPIDGIGLFADQFIAAGTKTWIFVPGFDLSKTEDELLAMPELARQWFKKYAYLDFHVGYHILCVDDARFMNHSEKPTVRPDYSLDELGVDIAVADINIGDELTADYRLFEHGEF